MLLLGVSAAFHLLLERPAHGVVVGGVRAHRVGRVGRHGGVGGERRGLGAQLVDLGAARLVALEPAARLVGAAREPRGVGAGEPRAHRALVVAEAGERLERTGDRAVVVLERVHVGLECLAQRLEPADHVLDPDRGAELGREELGRGPVECRDRLDRARIAGARVGCLLEACVQRRHAAILLLVGDDLLELALAQERALRELLDVEAEELLPDGEVVLAGEELGGDLLSAPVPYLDGAAGEIALHGVALAAGIELELDAVVALIPRAPALERRQQPAEVAAVAVEAVERGRDRLQQARLAALVLVDDEREPVRIEHVVRAQRTEAVGPESQDLHASISS